MLCLHRNLFRTWHHFVVAPHLSHPLCGSLRQRPPRSLVILRMTALRSWGGISGSKAQKTLLCLQRAFSPVRVIVGVRAWSDICNRKYLCTHSIKKLHNESNYSEREGSIATNCIRTLLKADSERTICEPRNCQLA